MNKSCRVRDVQSRFESTVRACSRLASKDSSSLERLHPGGRGPCCVHYPQPPAQSQEGPLSVWGSFHTVAPWLGAARCAFFDWQNIKKKNNPQISCQHLKDEYVHIQVCISGYDMGRPGHLGPRRHKSPAQGTLSCTPAAAAHPPPVQPVCPVGQAFCHLTARRLTCLPWSSPVLSF